MTSDVHSRIATSNSTTEVTQETLSFIDPANTVSVDGTVAPDAVGSSLLNHSDEDMGNFLSRPIFIYNDTWTPAQGAAETATIDPWTLFLGNKRVINRLNNYRNLRGTLVLRIMMNGNSFYYGRLLLDYLPLAPLRTLTGVDPTNAYNNILASQRMHVYLDPSQSTTTELRLPFFWFYDAVDITTAEWSSLGRLYIRQLAGLKHANGGTAPINYTIAAWMEDVQLGTPTVINSVSVVPQAKVTSSTEKVGAVSKVASALSRAASALSSIPVIGPWATASSVALSAVSSVAKIFGWSRPLELTPAKPMRPIYNPPFAPTDAEDYSQKLTVDSKNELSVDSRITGYDAGDELTVSHLTGLESYLTSAPWTAAAASGTLLWNTYVTPALAATDATYYYLPAAHFCARPFQYWRGCMKFRVQVVCSSYHRGRLLITWDPLYVSSVEPNVQVTRVVDITEEKDFTICVGWGHPQHFLPLDTIAASALNYGTAAKVAASTKANGVLSISVLNELATPSAVVSDISLLVFVSMEDAEFAAPTTEIQLYDNYHITPQALEESGTKPNPDPNTADMEVTCHEVKDDNHANLIYFGEHVPSLRPLLHRYNFNNSNTYTPNAATSSETWNMFQNDYPLYYGYDTVANTLSTTAAAKHVNYSRNSLMNWLMPAFAGVRGSVRSKYIARASQNNLIDMVLTRAYSDSGYNFPFGGGFGAGAGVTPIAYARAIRVNVTSSSEGAAYANTSKQPLLEAELPFYRPVRFACGYAMDSTKPYATNSMSHRLDVTTTGSTLPVIVDRWVAAGEDFNLTWFQGCPPVATLVPPAI